MDAYNFVVENIGKAFSTMSEFEVLPGVSVLVFSVLLLILHTLFDILWFGAKSYTRHELNASFRDANKERKKGSN